MPDRDVDEHHPAPVDLGEDSTEDQADRGAGSRHGRVDTHCAVALFALGELGGDERQCGGRGNGGTESLDGAERQQRPFAPREAAAE